MDKINLIESFTHLARIQPFNYMDNDTGNNIAIALTPYYLNISINKRTYHFIKETGAYDGWSDILHEGPILICD